MPEQEIPSKDINLYLNKKEEVRLSLNAISYYKGNTDWNRALERAGELVEHINTLNNLKGKYPNIEHHA